MTLPVYTSPVLANVRESREAIRYQAIVGSADLYIKGRRQKLSATPDLSGTVLPYVLFRTQR